MPSAAPAATAAALLSLGLSCRRASAAGRSGAVSGRRRRFAGRQVVARRAAESDADGEVNLEVPREEPPMATHGAGDSERSRAATVIQNRILSEPQYQAVLKLVEKYLPKFDVVNMVSAMHICAIAGRDGGELTKRQIQVDPNFATLLSAVKRELLLSVAVVSPRTTSDLLWSCAHLSVFDSDLFNSIAADAATRLETFSGKSIAMLVFALGYVQQRPRQAFMQALLRELRARINTEFEPIDVNMIVYGMMRLGIKNDVLMRIVGEHLQRTGMADYSEVDVVCLTFAYCKLEYWDPEVIALLGKNVVMNIETLSARGIVMSALSFATAVGYLEEAKFTMDALIKATEQRLDNFTPSQFASYCFAVGKYANTVDIIKGERVCFKRLVFQDDPTPKEFVRQVMVRGFDQFTSQEFNLVNYSIMRLKYRNEDYLMQAAAFFIERVAEMDNTEILNAMYAFGRCQFVHLHFITTMVQELKRRNAIEEMQPLQLAITAYCLAMARVREEELIDQIAGIFCERVKEFSAQSCSMMVWSMAVLNTRNLAEPVVSACMEEMSARVEEFNWLSTAIILWASAVIAGSSSGIWALDVLFKQGFWNQPFEPTAYAMIYHMFASLGVEEGLPVQEMQGWSLCRRYYEEMTYGFGSQNQRISERLRMQQVPHDANSMPPALASFREAGMRSDVVIEDLKLILEVEGPQRMTLPLDKLWSSLGDADEERYKKVCGRADEVIAETRGKMECGLTGSAAFKRRVLRKCGWRVITVSFDENEEYIADALGKMVEKKHADGAGDAAAAPPPSQPRSFTEKEEAPLLADLSDLVDPAAPLPPSSSGQLFEAQEELSEMEKRVRLKHLGALEELRRRIVQERGNAAASAAFANHVEYRRWQVGIEKEVLKEFVASI